MVIQHNMTAFNSNRQLGIMTGYHAKSSEKLASGYRINRAADDAAGLAISEKMRRQIRGLDQGSNNLQDGISMMQIADGALVEVHEMLQRMSELTIKAANDTLDPRDRQHIQQEINQLKLQISQVGSSTTFNERKIFDDIYPEGAQYKKLSDLVTSSSADSGKMTEAYKVGDYWYPSASLNFGGIDDESIDALDGKGFSFTCAANCDEVFEFEFDRSTSESKIEGSTTYHQGTHKYIIGIEDCTNGADIVNKIFDFAANNPLEGAPTGQITATSVPVSHTNTIVKTGSTTFILWGHVGSHKTAEEAKNHHFSNGMGEVNCSNLDGETGIEKRDLWIQASANSGDGIKVTINRMNSKVIGVDGVDVTTSDSARAGIDTVKKAQGVISKERASIGAQQNRLEHSYRNNRNIEENTTASESLIRDTDMAKEMVKNSNENILMQAGQAMLAQANQTTQGAMTLLQ